MRPLSVLSLICLFVTSTALAQNFQSHSYPVAARHLLAADFNHDGYTDLLAYGSGSAKVLRNNKSGGLGTTIVVSSADANEAAIADFNGDGYPDVVLCGPSAVRVFRNNSGSSFTQIATLISRHGCNGVVAADVNHDGKADVVIGTTTPDSTGSAFISKLVTFFGDGAGHFTAPSTHTINVGDTTGNYPDCYVSELAGSDFRATGLNDLLVFTYCENGTVNSGQAFFAKNSGSGQYTLTYLSNVAIDSPNDPPKVVDLNHDLLPDVIMPTWLAGPHGSNDYQTNVFLNQGGGNFTAQNVFDQSDYAASYLSAVFAADVADFTGDGKPDIAASFTNSPDGCCTPARRASSCSTMPAPTPGTSGRTSRHHITASVWPPPTSTTTTARTSPSRRPTRRPVRRTSSCSPTRRRTRSARASRRGRVFTAASRPAVPPTRARYASWRPRTGSPGRCA